MALPIFDRLVDRGKEEPDYFLALEISASRVKSAAWIVANGQTEVIAVGSTSFWSGKDLEELVKTVDDSLSGLAQRLSEITQKEASKVIFGLPSYWVEKENKIKEDKVVFLKETTKKLELTPIGFVVTSEALIEYLKDQEGVPPSVVTVEVEEEEIEVTLVHLGKIIGRTRVARSVAMGADLEEGLTRFMPQAVLPSRILLFDGRSNLEDSRQQLLDHPWKSKGSKLPFLHFPKVEILSEEETVKAVALAGGAEAAKAIGLEISEKPPVEPRLNPAEATGQEPVSQEEEKPVESSPEEAPIPPKPEKFGFVANKDVAKNISVSAAAPKQTPALPRTTPIVSSKPPAPPRSFKPPLSLNSLLFWKKLHFHFSSPPAAFVLVGGSFIFIFAIALFLWWQFGSARITLQIQAKSLSRDQVLLIDPRAAQVNLAQGVIPGKLLTGQATGQQTADTTGQKLVGTKAKGSVMLYNNTGSEVDLKAGTTITSDTGLKFTLDNTAAVASPSGTAANPTPGQTTASVTAADVGPEYNLAGGSSFNLPGFSAIQVLAKSQDAFAGGDKRQVQAVGSDDQANLSKLLTDSLSPKAVSNLRTTLPSGYFLIESSISVNTTSANFDKKVGDEGTSLTLSQTTQAQGLSISQNDLASFFNNLIREQFGQNYFFDPSSSTIDFASVKTATGSAYQVTSHLKLTATPTIDLEALKSRVAGKTKEEADTIFGTTPGFISESVSMFPDLPGPFATLPHNPGKIVIDLKTTVSL